MSSPKQPCPDCGDKTLSGSCGQPRCRECEMAFVQCRFDSQTRAADLADMLSVVAHAYERNIDACLGLLKAYNEDANFRDGSLSAADLADVRVALYHLQKFIRQRDAWLGGLREET